MYNIGISGGNDPFYEFKISEHHDVSRRSDYKDSNLWRRTGRNLGNLVWAHSARFLFDSDHVSFHELSPGNINSGKLDLIALLLANIFKASDRNEMLAKSMYDRLIDTKTPIVVLSVGVQHPDTDTIVELGPECLKLLDLLSRKAIYIGVRGEYTKRVFLHYGVNNNKLMKVGCPSILMNLKPDLGKSLERGYNTPFDSHSRSCATSLPAYNHKHALSRKLIDIAVSSKGICHIQSTVPLLEALTDEMDLAEQEALIREIFPTEADSILKRNKYSLDEWFKTYFAYYNDLPNWVNDSSEYNYGLVGRIHGGIVLLSAQVPTVIIGIDSRVVELCDTFYIPYVSSKEFMEAEVGDLFASVDFDGLTFDLNRRLIARLFEKMLVSAGAPVSKELKSFI